MTFPDTKLSDQIFRDNFAVKRQDGVAHIILNRPKSLNAMTVDMVSGIHTTLAELRDDASVGAILFSGSGKGFCAGVDLQDDDNAKSVGLFIKEMRTIFHPLMQEIISYPKPVVSAVHGVCAGGGLGFVTSSDIVVCSTTARFIPAFAKVGLVPDCGTTWMLPRKIGLTRARGWSLLGDEIDGVTAAEWGLVWKATPEENVLDSAMEIAKRLADGPGTATNLCRNLYNSSGDTGLFSAMDAEIEAQSIAMASPEFAEGKAAFLEKRAPKFTKF